MEINVINVITVALLCGLTAFMSNKGMAVFHDGLRPVIPEFLEGRMKRSELATVAFGLSIGFIASVGIANALTTNLLNPWLLFLATDIIGILIPNMWLAAAAGAGYGLACLFGISGINAVLTMLPVDMVAGMGSLGSYVVTGFAVFPIIAIIMQFGFKSGLISALVVLGFRIVGPMFSTISGDAWTMMVGVIALVALCIIRDRKANKEAKQSGTAEVSTENVFSERTARIKKNLPFLMAAGALICLACNLHIFAGSTVTMFDLSEAYAMGNTPEAQAIIQNAATNELMRSLSFIPLIATTALTTGVYGVAGFTFIYAAGYLLPNPILALIAGAAIIFVEVMLLGFLGKFLGRFPSLRDASDNIRSSMNMVVEFSLIFGAFLACTGMGALTSVGAAGGFFIGAVIYMINEATGKKIMPMAIGPVAAIGTGLILNLLYLVQLVTLVG